MDFILESPLCLMIWIDQFINKTLGQKPSIIILARALDWEIIIGKKLSMTHSFQLDQEE